MKLLLDANISWRLLKRISEEFPGPAHVEDTNLTQPAKDTAIWNFALNSDYIIVTNDEDFYEFSVYKGFPPKIIILRTGNLSTKYLAELLIRHKSEIMQFYSSDELGILEIF